MLILKLIHPYSTTGNHTEEYFSALTFKLICRCVDCNFHLSFMFVIVYAFVMRLLIIHH